MKKTQNLDDIIRGCAKGDRICQHALYKMFYGKLMAICHRYTRNDDQAKDILQEGFIKVFNHIKDYERKGSFEGWLKRIITNTAIDYYRKRSSDFLLMNEENDIEAAKYIEDEGEEEIFNGMTPNEVLAAVKKLSPAYQMVFNLYVVEDYSHKEIAEMLGISIGTSKSNLAKAKQNLRNLLHVAMK
jgi:RNA polymerase sigma factor (sigma-70 family)